MLSKEDATKVLNGMMDEYHIESFEDAANMCTKLQFFAKACLVYADEQEFDEVTRYNLQNLRTTMRLASKMFIQCDEYFR